jgi:3',5'-nucleoside bisphosphate phosphatase
LRIDLHLHSTASDGSLSPSGLLWAARAGGLDVIALTDHDTCAGVTEALGSVPDHLHVIPGIELSTHHDSCEQHILGYFIDHQHEALQKYSATAVDKRRERLKHMLSKLDALGLHLTIDEVADSAESNTRALGRPHLARAMVRRGFVPTVAEAFDRFIGDHGPAYLPTQLISAADGIKLIHEIGGVAIWAHPRVAALERYLDALVSWGMDGIECFRPSVASAESLHLEETALRRGLLITGGSDWHGTWQGRLGDFYVSHDEVEKLLEVGGM